MDFEGDEGDIVTEPPPIPPIVDFEDETALSQGWYTMTNLPIHTWHCCFDGRHLDQLCHLIFIM